MLKITKRLEQDNENVEHYIYLVGSCMRRRKDEDTKKFIKKFNKCIILVMKEVRDSGNRALLTKMKEYFLDWRHQYSHITYEIRPGIRISRLVMAWLVMPYDLMKELRWYVKAICNKHLLGDKSWRICYDSFSRKGVNNWIIEVVDNKVCPYCNLSFIYSRSKNTTSAELDHFYCESKYPLFALNFYNLIPACRSCNHIKWKTDDKRMVSPYDENAYDNLRIDYTFSDKTKLNVSPLEENIKIKFRGNKADKRHLKVMKIRDAYDNHRDYAAELIEKIRIYNNKAARMLIQGGIKISLSKADFQEIYFGKYISEPEKRILGKMTTDFLEKYLK